MARLITTNSAECLNPSEMDPSPILPATSPTTQLSNTAEVSRRATVPDATVGAVPPRDEVEEEEMK